jgi:hypothetical protein
VKHDGFSPRYQFLDDEDSETLVLIT